MHAVFPTRVDWLAFLPGALVVWAVLAIALPQRSGLPAMITAFEEPLFLATIAVLAPTALWRRARTLLALLLVCAVVGGGLFGSAWVSLPGSGASRHDLTVMSWNVRAGARSPADQVAQLKGTGADLIALQEVEPDAAAAIEADAELALLYPYRAVAPRPGTWGLAVLSRYPISGVVSLERPSLLELTVATPQGAVQVIDVHVNPPNLYAGWPIPVAYDTADREADVAALREPVQAALSAGERLLVVGDFNTTPSEAEYGVITAGLRDTHVEVGEGPGWTWRPSLLAFLGVGFMRIDLQLTGGPIRPASTWTDCSLAGDHCRLFGSYEVD
jgi:vancomycin resistance protein VanJ